MSLAALFLPRLDTRLKMLDVFSYRFHCFHVHFGLHNGAGYLSLRIWVALVMWLPFTFNLDCTRHLTWPSFTRNLDYTAELADYFSPTAWIALPEWLSFTSVSWIALAGWLPKGSLTGKPSYSRQVNHSSAKNALIILRQALLWI